MFISFLGTNEVRFQLVFCTHELNYFSTVLRHFITTALLQSQFALLQMLNHICI